jgi:hypothetical protein
VAAPNKGRPARAHAENSAAQNLKWKKYQNSFRAFMYDTIAEYATVSRNPLDKERPAKARTAGGRVSLRRALLVARSAHAGLGWQKFDASFWASQGLISEDFGNSRQADSADGVVGGVRLQYKIARPTLSIKRVDGEAPKVIWTGFMVNKVAPVGSGVKNVILFVDDALPSKDWPLFYGTTEELFDTAMAVRAHPGRRGSKGLWSLGSGAWRPPRVNRSSAPVAPALRVRPQPGSRYRRCRRSLLDLTCSAARLRHSRLHGVHDRTRPDRRRVGWISTVPSWAPSALRCLSLRLRCSTPRRSASIATSAPYPAAPGTLNTPTVLEAASRRLLSGLTPSSSRMLRSVTEAASTAVTAVPSGMSPGSTPSFALTDQRPPSSVVLARRITTTLPPSSKATRDVPPERLASRHVLPVVWREGVAVPGRRPLQRHAASVGAGVCAADGRYGAAEHPGQLPHSLAPFRVASRAACCALREDSDLTAGSRTSGEPQEGFPAALSTIVLLLPAHTCFSIILSGAHPADVPDPVPAPLPARAKRAGVPALRVCFRRAESP